jgi:adenylyltransferase/sulfurtransferase
MTPDQVARYARQVRLASVGESGQRQLLQSRMLIVGLGGLGSPVAMYLAASGVGTLVLSDFDRVETSNLQRQIVHRERDIGELKAESARTTLAEINPGCRVETINWQMDEAELLAQARLADVILDCSDNFATRFLLNRVAVRESTPLVSGAAIREEGQLLCVLPGGRPCYECMHPEHLEHQESCAMEGVLAPVVGVIGCLQAMQAIKVVCGAAEQLRGKLMLFDGGSMTWHNLKVPPRNDCRTCGLVDQ